MDWEVGESIAVGWLGSRNRGDRMEIRRIRVLGILEGGDVE